MLAALPPDGLTAPQSRDDAGRGLRRARWLASGLLVLMAGLTLVALLLPPSYAAQLLQAGAKAGLVGGIADWFAVTALFRHPLGLPIPHTAIIPRQKARLGASLGRFVANHVFTEQDVAGMLRKLDLPAMLCFVLEDPATAGPAASTIARLLPRLLASLQDGRARRLLARVVPRLLGGADTGLLVARALRALVAGGRHQDVFGFVLQRLRDGMQAQEEGLRVAIEDRVREQGGRLIGWALGGSVARRVLHAVNAEFEKMEPDSSELRASFDEWARGEIERIETDPARAEEIGRAIRDFVSHDTVTGWFWDVWSRMRLALERDAADPQGRAMALLRGALADLGRGIADDPAGRARLELAVGSAVTRTLPAIRQQLAEFIARVVAGWDSATITERLEQRVGRDLQFVRVNGTLVGFLAGAALFAALHAVFGTVAP